MPRLTRGPLPARVYWFRRLLVLGTAFALVFGIGRLLVGGSDASSGQDAAAQVAADTTPTVLPTDDLPTMATTPTGKRRPKSADPSPTLAAPEGECDGSDIAVTPEVTDAVAGRPVLIVLQLRTLESEACTWRIGRDALTVGITSGKDQIWSSRQCPRAIPVRDVVVRKAVTTKVGIQWSAKRSDDECSKFTQWAMPGWYHVAAAALGGEPSDLQFELERPAAVTVTQTASPKQTPSNNPSNNPGNKPSNSPSNKPSNSPSGRPVTNR